MASIADEGIFHYHLQQGHQALIACQYPQARDHYEQAYQAAFRLFYAKDYPCQKIEPVAAYAQSCLALARYYHTLEDIQAQEDYLLQAHESLMAASTDYDRSAAFRRQCFDWLQQTLHLLLAFYGPGQQAEAQANLISNLEVLTCYFAPDLHQASG
ncbi:hypothetical protein [Balneatrix alpica]|uniref:Uncharacterized protein n=1 Tax=Balneatrix alpica TaxID=75684 RepID=A0ABV5ZDU9_9GAMM|nr:hypothetical protein [Balneatrix alpica]